jgi:hypothetical protein
VPSFAVVYWSLLVVKWFFAFGSCKEDSISVYGETSKVWLTHPLCMSFCGASGLPMAVDSASGMLIRETFGEPNDRYFELEFIASRVVIKKYFGVRSQNR